MTEDGRCVITTPGAGYAVGEVLCVLGSGAVYGIAPSDWVVRLVAGYQENRGNPWGEGVDARPAYEALLEALARVEAGPTTAGVARLDGRLGHPTSERSSESATN
jgi:hypothetical protein